MHAEFVSGQMEELNNTLTKGKGYAWKRNQRRS